MNDYELSRIEDAFIDSMWKVRRRLFLQQALIRRDLRNSTVQKGHPHADTLGHRTVQEREA